MQTLPNTQQKKGQQNIFISKSGAVSIGHKY